MAKTTGPLMSLSASGKFADSIVFQKNGYARKWLVPANPQTTGQMAVRNRMADIQSELKDLGLVLRGELKSGLGARWNSVIIKELMDNDHAALDAYVAEWNAFVAGDKTAWATADEAASHIVIVDGALLYAVASAVYDVALRLGVVISLTLPVTGNSSTVGTEWRADA
jgi:hypothetical protein